MILESKFFLLSPIEVPIRVLKLAKQNLYPHPIHPQQSSMMGSMHRTTHLSVICIYDMASYHLFPFSTRYLRQRNCIVHSPSSTRPVDSLPYSHAPPSLGCSLASASLAQRKTSLPCCFFYWDTIFYVGVMTPGVMCSFQSRIKINQRTY